MKYKILTPEEVEVFSHYTPAKLGALHHDFSKIVNELAEDGDDVSTDDLYKDPMTIEEVKKIYDHGNVC